MLSVVGGFITVESLVSYATVLSVALAEVGSALVLGFLVAVLAVVPVLVVFVMVIFPLVLLIGLVFRR